MTKLFQNLQAQQVANYIQTTLMLMYQTMPFRYRVVFRICVVICNKTTFLTGTSLEQSGVLVVVARVVTGSSSKAVAVKFLGSLIGNPFALGV